MTRFPRALMWIRWEPSEPDQAAGHCQGMQQVPRHTAASANMIERIGQAIAVADGADFQVDQVRYRRLAAAALKPLLHPTEAMIDAAHEVVWFDAFWAINSRADFKKAVRAMIASAINQSDP